MFRLFETICIKNGVPQNLFWHERRMNKARHEVWNQKKEIRLAEQINVPESFVQGVVKCNIEYGPDIQLVYYNRYKPRKIKSLKMIFSCTVDYHLKFCDRSVVESLFDRRGNCDEIVIIKDGFLTDTSISNLIFFDGRQWFTPNTPLLMGTCRDRLIARGEVLERPITPFDLDQFIGVKLINAMRDPEDQELIPIGNIYG
jgi:4-amino-4-deoxychorismate lyase